VQTREELLKLHARLKTTTIYVTHDQIEAMTMGHRIVVMRSGVVQQVGKPQQVYDHPVNTFVAAFLGSPRINLHVGRLEANGEGLAIVTDGAKVPLTDRLASQARALKSGDEVGIGVRPEDIVVGPADGKGLPVVVDLVEELGADGYLYGHTDIDGKRTDIVARVDGRRHPNAGETVTLAATAGHVHAFDLETGERLNDAPVISGT